ncbi:hypothetical protein FI667_g15392, partial [Globisporangium splendens]
MSLLALTLLALTLLAIAAAAALRGALTLFTATRARALLFLFLAAVTVALAVRHHRAHRVAVEKRHLNRRLRKFHAEVAASRLVPTQPRAHMRLACVRAREHAVDHGGLHLHAELHIGARHGFSRKLKPQRLALDYAADADHGVEEVTSWSRLQHAFERVRDLERQRDLQLMDVRARHAFEQQFRAARRHQRVHHFLGLPRVHDADVQPRAVELGRRDRAGFFDENGLEGHLGVVVRAVSVRRRHFFFVLRVCR